MLVKELIEKLQKLPQDVEVVVWNDTEEKYGDVLNPVPVDLIDTGEGLIDDTPMARNTYSADPKPYVSITLP